ncbi:MAG: TadG family pilus assembly protein [Myxococcota bacterium]
MPLRTDTTASGRRARRGNYSMLMGTMLFVVVGFGALSVDISLITMGELQAQATADAASHAALIAYRENKSTVEGNNAAGFIINQNKVALGTAQLVGPPEYGTWDFDFDTFNGAGININAVRVGVERTGANAVDLLLAPILGINEADVDGEAITAQQQRAVMVVSDNSCSMMTGVANDANAAINISRLANLEFWDFLVDRPQDGDLLGLAIFAQGAAIEPIGAHPWGSACPYLGACPGGRPNSTEDPWLPLQEIQGNALIPERINGICDSMVGTQNDVCSITGVPRPHIDDIGSCTNPEAALMQAVDELATKADPTMFRAIVYMSDGMPNCNVTGGFNIGGAQARATAIRNQAENLGIVMWVITITSNGTFDTTFNDSLVIEPGFSQVSDNAADLPNMFKAVARAFPTALVE